MNFTILSVSLAVGLFISMLLCLEFGRRLGASRLAQTPDKAKASAGALEASVFGLMGLLVAFTFSGASGRFEARRHLINEEVNAIGTAWLRLDMLPPAAQPALRDQFRLYTDARIAAYAKPDDTEYTSKAIARTQDLQRDIWNAATAACKTEEGQRAAIIVLPALNQMFDIASTRLAATKMHPPAIIFIMLFMMALGSSFLTGYDLANAKSLSWVHILGFSSVMAFVVYIIIDLEYPRLGLIRVDEMDVLLEACRRSMN